jgi:putative ABC transport system permease protein
MNAFVPQSAGRGGWRAPLPLRFALREMRGGLRGFAVFIACIALGVMAIAGVGSLAASLADGLAREGSVILGGDVAFSLIHREASPAERAFLDSQGTVSVAGTMRTMARTDGGAATLVELKAVDGRYPLYGTPRLDPAMPLAEALRERDGVFGAAVESTLLARLDLRPGDRIRIGEAPIEVRAVLTSEPDKLAGGIGFGPRLLTSEAALRASGLLQPGSLVRWRYRVKLPAAASDSRAADRVVAAARERLPEAGWGIRTRDKASPSLERNVDRFAQFLTLVGLTALLIGGVGVANAVKGHLDRRREAIATMKALGATGGRVFAVYLLQILMFAAIGTAIGLVLGAALPFLVTWAFGAVLPLPLDAAVQPEKLALAALFGLLTAAAFTLWPLGRAHDIPVSALFREQVAVQTRLPRRRYVIATVVVIAALAALAVGLAYDRRVAAIFVAAAAVVLVVLQLVGQLVMLAASRVPRVRAPLLRLAVVNIHRPGALTATVVQSLGLGLALLVVVTQIDGNLRRQFLAVLPEKAPSLYFLDVRANEADAFDAFLRQHAPDAKIERVPMLRGRIVSAHGVKAGDLNPTEDAAWVLRSDRGLTYASEIPRGSRIVAGEWWPPDVSGPPLVSMEKRIAEGLGLKLGDSITVNVLGRNITARVANLRSVDWESLGINFVLVYSPNTFRGAPHTVMATLTYADTAPPAAGLALLKSVAAAFPTVTVVRVKEILAAIGDLVGNLAAAIRGASAVTLIAAVLVLGGALAAGRRHRVYDAVILKTLGATRRRLLIAFVLEYLLLGLTTAVFGVSVGSIAAFFVLRDVMHLPFVWLPLPAFAAALGALIVTVALGLLGTYTALGQKPAQVLRNL